jgi:tetratricopeptide (TPR) repeat protein
MAFWGMALAMGPNINTEIDPGRQKIAYAFVQKAVSLYSEASPKERDYINALAKRYSADRTADVRVLGRNYANAMRELAQRYPEDLDASTLYAESLMDLHPWQQWRPDGSPGEDTEEIIQVLESVLKRDPNHIGANHYYIHAIESSRHAERGLKNARRLESLAPASGLLVHMPSHIYMRVGDYDAAARSNEAAVEADRSYLSRTSIWGGSYDAMYYNHNLYALVAAYSLAGRLADAKRVAQDLVTHANSQLAGQPEAEFYEPTEIFVLLRFGRWDEILIAPCPQANLFMATAFWHFARGVAAARRGLTETAEKERNSLLESRQTLRTDVDFGGYFNKAGQFLDLAISILDARIAWLENDRVTAIKHWRQAMEIEDSFRYSEPPDWYYPVRESLGAALLLNGKLAEAECIFRADLERNPGNPRSLFGLWRTLVLENNFTSAEQVAKEFAIAWKRADVRLELADY